MLHGCDISKWQGMDFDFSGEEFIIAKATEGRTYTDKCFLHFIEKAIIMGKCIGAYHYARPENNTPKEEAEHFVNVIRPYIGRCLLALDWEGVALTYPIEWALEWMLEVERLTGVKPVIYCSSSYIPKCKKIADNGNGIWAAKWGELAPMVKPTFSVMALWQYTSTPYDKDKFFGDKKTWQKYCDTSLKIDAPTDEGAHNCGCEFCEDFRKWLSDNGYTKIK